MKKIICITLLLTLLFSGPISQVCAAESENNDIFFGYIKVLTSEVNIPEPYRAAKDQEATVYIHAGDFAKIIGGTVTHESDRYQYRFGVWSLTITCNDLQAQLLYQPSDNGKSYHIYDNFTLPNCLYNAEEVCWYLPMEQMLYLSLSEWFCIENFVAVYQPETLLDIVPDIPALTADNPNYSDLMLNSNGSNIGNSINYAFWSTIDELNMTFIKDTILISFGAQEYYTFEDDILKSTLLLLSDDSPLDNTDDPPLPLEVNLFSDVSDFISKTSYAVEAAGSTPSISLIETLASLNGTPLTASEIQSITNGMGKLSTGLNVGSVAIDFFMSVGSTLWTRHYIPENFRDRLVFMQECATTDTNNSFAQQLGKVAKSAETEHYAPLGTIASNITLDQIYGLISAFSAEWPGNYLLSYPQFTLATFDLLVEQSKANPVLAKCFETAEQAHACLYLLEISNYMEGVGNNIIRSLSLDTVKLDQEFLDYLRNSYQISQCSAMHAHRILTDIKKLNSDALTSGTELLLRLSTSSRHDQLLLLSSDYAGIYSVDPGCIREAIPAEYVFGGEGIFLSPIEQAQQVPEGYVGIYTNDDFLNIQNDMFGSYILMKDLTFDNWTPLGGYSNSFCGILDGNGHSVTINCNQLVPYDASTFGGVFYCLDSAIVQNLCVKGDLHYYGDKRYKAKPFDYQITLAGISAKAQNGSTIFNCVNESNISCDVPFSIYKDELVAGIVGSSGYQEPVHLSYCRNLGTLFGKGCVAGIACEFDDGSIIACQNDGNITSTSYAAGIVNDGYSILSSCANRGDIDGCCAGGIANFVQKSVQLSDCINMGHIIATSNGSPAFTSGIATFTFGTVKNCINLGETTGWGGGISGEIYQDGKLLNCFWFNEDEVSYRNADNKARENNSPAAGKLSESQMMNKLTFPNYDFLTVWTLQEGMRCPYPSALLYNGQKPPLV